MMVISGVVELAAMMVVELVVKWADAEVVVMVALMVGTKVEYSAERLVYLMACARGDLKDAMMVASLAHVWA